MKKKTVAMIMIAILAIGMMTGCGSTETKTDAAQQTKASKLKDCEILVAAAASLKNAYKDELIPMFNKIYPNVTVKGTYDSSGKLQTQIEEGLEADVFMPAATKQMNILIDEGLIDTDSNVELLENKIVLIVPAGREAHFTSFQSIADAGIVYTTDAASMADQVTVVAEAPKGSLKTPVIYPVAVVKNSAHQEASETFINFLQKPKALVVFEKYGFTVNAQK
jgi:molybdate transport system substrate-binding protein